MRRKHTGMWWCLTAGVALGLVTGACAADQDRESPALAATDLRLAVADTNDAIQAGLDGGAILVEVLSRRGIGSATIESASGAWPDTLRLRLHLRGLEKLEISTASHRVHVTIPSHGDSIRVRQATGDEPQTMAPGDPLWLAVVPRRATGARAERMPLDDGYVDVELSRTTIQRMTGSNTTLHLSWIDFYRQ